MLVLASKIEFMPAELFFGKYKRLMLVMTYEYFAENYSQVQSFKAHVC